MNIIRWAISILLGGVFIFIAVLNAYILFLQFKSKKDYVPSIAPAMGGILGCIALIVLPLTSLRERLIWIWVPIISDVGTGYYFGTFMIYFAYCKITRKEL